MALNPINMPQPSSSGGKGGLWGKIAGGIAGAVAAPFTGGASLATIPALMGTGAMVGETVGSMADPMKMKDAPQGPNMLDSAIKRDPSLQIGVLTQGQEALRDLGLPHNDYLTAHNTLEEAKKRISGSPIMG